jgi:1-acyl-sn-glycerol-3-phosphate acyltransferase
MGDEAADAIGTEEATKWDPTFTEQVKNWAGPLIKRYFRAEVNGLDAIPPAGGALLVSNHSGGMFTPDVLVFAPAFYDKFGFDRPVYTLAHQMIFVGPLADWMHRVGVIEANRENAAKALRSGALVLVFPGGDYDSYRSTLSENKIDFAGRTGYIRTAIETDVPIVPMVSIGAQESQLFLTRGNWLAKRLGLPRLRAEILPVTFGFPFGFSVFFPPNIPLPTKIVTEVLDPIDVVGEFGEDPDVDAVDAHIREVMQTALDRLAKKRRFPIHG